MNNYWPMGYNKLMEDYVKGENMAGWNYTTTTVPSEWLLVTLTDGSRELIRQSDIDHIRSIPTGLTVIQFRNDRLPMSVKEKITDLAPRMV